jgi:hypothetical protein
MTVRRLSCLVLAGALAACASGGVTRVTDPSQPRLVGEGTPVTVSWGDPAQFTEVRYSTNPTLASEGDWVVELADYVSAKTARAVPAGDKVDVQILDIQRAGQFEWSYGAARDLRVLRDIYPPRIELRFRPDGRERQRHRRRRSQARRPRLPDEPAAAACVGHAALREAP